MQQGRDDDQAALFRAEIRALKGVVLGARKFPAPPPVVSTGVGTCEAEEEERPGPKGREVEPQER